MSGLGRNCRVYLPLFSALGGSVPSPIKPHTVVDSFIVERVTSIKRKEGRKDGSVEGREWEAGRQGRKKHKCPYNISIL